MFINIFELFDNVYLTLICFTSELLRYINYFYIECHVSNRAPIAECRIIFIILVI